MRVALHSRFRKAIAALILVCWLPFALPGGAVANTFGVIAESNEQQPGAPAPCVICHCANCPGGKLCCCRRRTKTSSHGYCFCAGCGRSVPLAAPVVVPKVLPAAPVRLSDVPIGAAVVKLMPIPDPFRPSRAPSPLFLPPRLS